MALYRRALAFLRAFLTIVPGVLDTSTGRFYPKIMGAAEEEGKATDDKPQGKSGNDDDGNDDDKGEPGESEKTAEDYRKELRTYERNAKKSSKQKDDKIAELERSLKEREDADKSEHEKALEKAREEARSEAISEAEKERRSDRLEVAVTRAAAKGFADTEDALIHVQRRIRSGDIDESEIFDDDGKVQTAPLKSALEQLLADKPHLAAGEGRPNGSADGGRGASGGDALEEMSMDDHVKHVQRK